MKRAITPTAVERVMREDDFIISLTDTKGRITYGNRIFIEFSGYTEDELLGTQHNIIRHPDMPRSVFKLLWDKIQAKEECFAYVKNMSKDGSFYWVFANITPTFSTPIPVSSHGGFAGRCVVPSAQPRRFVSMCTLLLIRTRCLWLPVCMGRASDTEVNEVCCKLHVC